MRKAAEFYWKKVSTQGGYHYYYAEDLSYGRSEHGEGPTQIEVQREATPIVGLTYLRAWEITGDRFYLEAARAAAEALIQGQHCSGVAGITSSNSTRRSGSNIHIAPTIIAGRRTRTGTTRRWTTTSHRPPCGS